MLCQVFVGCFQFWVAVSDKSQTCSTVFITGIALDFYKLHHSTWFNRRLWRKTSYINSNEPRKGIFESRKRIFEPRERIFEPRNRIFKPRRKYVNCPKHKTLTKGAFLWEIKSENAFCVALLNRSIQHHSHHGASAELKNPCPEWILRFLSHTLIREILD